MMDIVDLHVHTTASDGTKTAEEVLSLASSCGLKAVAVTDHDTVSGIIDSHSSPVELIPGIEFSTKFITKVHILGYYIDIDNAELKKQLKQIIDDRDERNEKIVQAMRNDGIAVSYDEMKERFGEIVGRPHFAEVIAENGLAMNVSDAFDKYLEKGRPYWFPRTTLSLERCIALITGAGGIAVIAHPFEYKYEKNSLDDLIRECMRFGVTGMECRHPSHTCGQMAYLERICEDYGLLKTGGSDYHGDIKPEIRLGCGTGKVSVPYTWLEKIKESL